MYQIVDCQTGQKVGGLYKSRIAATRRADRLDLAYGAVRYVVRLVLADGGAK